MEQIIISEELKQEYRALLKAAQDVEASIGAAYCKLQKMATMRQQIDTELKSWWDKTSEEYKVDQSKDYYVTQDGTINLAQKPEEAQDGGASKAPKEEVAKGPEPEGEKVKEVQTPVAAGEKEEAPVVDNDAPVETATNGEAQAMVDSGEATIPAEAVVNIGDLK